MTGSLRISRGKYFAVLNLKDENGKRKQKTVNLHIDAAPGSKRRAQKALREVLSAYDASRVTVYSKSILFCDYLKLWLEDAKENLQPNTYESYQLNIDIHIFPYFKANGVLLTEMTYFDIKNYYTTKSKSLSGNTLKKHHALIRQTLRKAVQEGLLASNPAAEVTLPKTKKFIGSFLSVEQGHALLEAAKGTTIEPVIILAMMYGLRRSEIAGLKWSAIDLANDTLTVRHTVTKFKTEVAKDETKNASSYRVLPLNSAVKTFLEELRAQQEKDKLLLGAAYQNTEYVCRWPDGRALSPAYMSAAFRSFLEKNGFERIRLHDLRHSCASYMLKMGCNMKEISDWLGHADIHTSMNIYAHLDTEAKKEVSNRLGSLLSPSTQETECDAKCDAEGPDEI